MSLWLRFDYQGQIRIGVLENNEVRLCHSEDDHPFDNPLPSDETVKLSEVALLTPCTPSKMIALWNNYAALAEQNDLAHPSTPLYLFKPPNSFAGQNAIIRRPKFYQGEVFYEGELGIVIGKTVCNLDTTADGNDAIFGYTCINDVTAFGLLKEYQGFDQWSRAKGFDGFGIFGPGIATHLDWHKLEIITRINGEIVQHYPANDMILSPPDIVVKLSRDMTLYRGDVICCGTSVGLAAMPEDCNVEVEIAGIGCLKNRYQP
ncbi:MAG: fumarylacetoacetate hydrolase family protein [Chromatiales bacterium]|nr:fumarylacetoacetate hydrolase family protein [Chromatiales bacterium]